MIEDVFRDKKLLRNYFYWINERHRIYQKRANGFPGPWTGDSILRDYKFTNPFRENDRDTIWMRENWTGPNRSRPFAEQIFNCGFFRMFGGTDFLKEHGWVSKWDPERTKELAGQMLAEKHKVFTGAYIVTNQGVKAPKQQVVVDYFLTPLWDAREHLAEVARNNSLQNLHRAFKDLPGFGGGGFMAYEVVTDLNYTPVLSDAKDRYTWANAGPGAKRGLNRLLGRDLEKSFKNEVANYLMKDLLSLAPNYIESHVPIKEVDMRCIEHSLCEWDKYQRVLHKQGLPRSVFSVKRARPIQKGPVP